MDPQPPTVGRVVSYVSHGTPPREDGSQAHPSKTRAAIITAVHGTAEPGPEDPAGQLRWEVGLAVFNPSGIFFDQHVMQDESGTAPGTWHWPVWVMAA
ncbi:hypothetical protein [Streptomyces kronopolitis]|uniref:hypothetical protein n=1 Tax=Streptomyces kronopolitis TaxID=1612435 RepID=UPI003D95E87B